jgi:hypothetical protein
MIPHSRPLPRTPLLGRYHDGTCYEVGHTWHPSCLYCFLDLFYYAYVGALKVYAPLYLVRIIIKTLMQSRLWLIAYVCIDMLFASGGLAKLLYVGFDSTHKFCITPMLDLDGVVEVISDSL